MIKCTGFALFILLSALALAANDGDAVNERISVDKAELEAHWQVDCAATWARLQAAVARQSTQQDHCEITGELVRDTELCAFIYQAPGDKSTHQCPDFRAASHQLKQREAPADCASLSPSIVEQLACDRAGP